jgi:AcrR family transcriptional regulator
MQTMKNKRLPPEARGELLLDVAIELARVHGLANITRDQIAAEARVAAGLVSLRLGTMPAMRRTIMRNAIVRGILPIVAEGLAARDPFAMAAPEDLRKRAAASMAVSMCPELVEQAA